MSTRHKMLLALFVMADLLLSEGFVIGLAAYSGGETEIMVLKTVLIVVGVLGFQSVTLNPKTRLDPLHHTESVSDNRTSQREKAGQLWEQAIAAKGGRERLRGVHNIVISMCGEYGSRLLGKNEVRSETLVVFPNKSWNWSDYRPDVFGLRITMYNFDTNMKYVISEGEPYHQPERIPETERERLQMDGLLSDLLETKWLRPVLVGANTGRIGLRPVDIMETTVNGKRVDFALDQKTHLPFRVSYYDVVKGKIYITALDLSEYGNQRDQGSSKGEVL